ncbi:hypothetical protein MSG28_001039 [Choristoneura fumiferana]|uniref:Uncharacterized protein n=1 Tax=Choristoneura fumiferana TaxID=7141 RepID=A0ACC0K3T5_CHOFU|nr:hypothetical protein MSG28_001039 [Choristoneura fumiferana]
MSSRKFNHLRSDADYSPGGDEARAACVDKFVAESTCRDRRERVLRHVNRMTECIGAGTKYKNVGSIPSSGLDLVTMGPVQVATSMDVFVMDGGVLRPLTSDLVVQIIGDGNLSDFDESDLKDQFLQYDKEGGGSTSSDEDVQNHRAVARSVRVAAAAESRAPEKKGYEIARNMPLPTEATGGLWGRPVSNSGRPLAEFNSGTRRPLPLHALLRSLYFGHSQVEPNTLFLAALVVAANFSIELIRL